MGDTIWQRDDNWVGSEIEDSFVMVNIETGKYVSLNQTASAVWDLLGEPRSEDQIVSGLQERYAVEEAQCRTSLGVLLARLRELELAAPL